MFSRNGFLFIDLFPLKIKREIKELLVKYINYYYYSFICIYETSTHTISPFAKCTFANESKPKTYLQIFHIIRILLKSLKFPLTFKKVFRAVSKREKMYSALIDTGSKLYKLGQHDNGFCLEIAKFWTQTYNSLINKTHLEHYQLKSSSKKELSPIKIRGLN